MTTPPRVQRHRQADAARRRVTTRGKRVPRPRAPKPPARRKPKHQATGVLGSFSAMCVALFAATGSILWAVGGVASGVGGCASAYLEYRRDLIKVKATGKPIGAKPDPAPAARRTDDLSDVREPKPVNLDALTRPRQTRARKPVDEHLARCKANPPGGPTCRCPDGPNRRGAKKATTKSATRKRTTK